MAFLYNVRKDFPRQLNRVKSISFEDGISYRMRSRSPDKQGLLTLEAFVTKRPGDYHILDIIQTNHMPNVRLACEFSDLGEPRLIKFGYVGMEDDFVMQKEAEYDHHLGRVGRFISPLFSKLKKNDVNLLESFPAMRKYVDIQKAVS